MNNQDIDALFTKASHCWDEGRLKEAFELFCEAAKLGDESSMLSIGYFHDYGIYVEKDERKAIFWYKKAYHAGSSSAAGNIGVCYKQRKEYRRALWWWYKSAHMGDKSRLLALS